MLKTGRFYETPDGVKYPLYEAPIPFTFKVYRKDCKSAVVGDPIQCLIAKGAKRHRNVLHAFIGAGKDAYVIMKNGAEGKPIAVHYTLNAVAVRVRNTFDKQKKMAAQEITLDPPTAGRTLAHRSKLGKQRRAEIKAGAEVKKRGKLTEAQIHHIGSKHRPVAKIKKGVVSLIINNDERKKVA
jgi:hypothetical protein